MPLQTELTAYSAKINLPLLNSIVAFVLDTAEVTRAQSAEPYKRCPFLTPQDGSTFQERYGFLYLGELLERYEERFGMNTQDLRAIALAMSYTCDLTTAEMFVGTQREDFLRRVRRASDGDLYLAGALYLLDEGRDGATKRELRLTAAQYDSTEDLLFVLGLFADQEHALMNFKPQLLRLLGRERTMPILGNVSTLNWLITWLTPQIKAVKGKDTAPLRALCALPISNVKAGSKPHNALLEHGYTPLEIAYANMIVVLSQTAEGCLRPESIVSEKIAVALFHEALSGEAALAPEIYAQLSLVYQVYEKFKIKCYGQERLTDTLKDGTRIRNASTFLWFSRHADIYHPVFSGFDIMDSKWDPLASALEPKQYLSLFELCLQDDMDRERIQLRLDRYQELTGKNYPDVFWENSCGSQFGLLVNKGILNLWELFQHGLSKDRNNVQKEITSNIWNYAHRISTMQAYEFFQSFFDTYGPGGLEQFFGYRHQYFIEALTTRQSYGNGPFQLKLHRDFLDDDGHRQMLHWLEEYFFTYKPEDYTLLTTAILLDEFSAGLFSAEEQRKLFDHAVQQSNLSMDALNILKRRYLSEAELQAEQEAQAAARKDAERRQQAELVQSIRERYAEMNDTFSSVSKFLDEYKYYRDRQPIACEIAREGLDEILEGQNYTLDCPEAVQLFHVCGKLVKQGVLSLTEAQDYILNVKERAEHDTDD